MNRTTKTGIEIIEASLVLGVSGNLLLRSAPFGLNIALWTVLLVVVMIAIMKRSGAAGWNANTISLYMALVFFAGMFALFDSPELLFLDGFAVVLILAALVVPALFHDITRAGVVHYIMAGCASVLSAAFGAIALVGDDIKWGSLPKTNFTRYSISVLRGLALAVPISIVIGGLLMAADASFQSFVEDTFLFNPNEILVHATITSAIAWGVLGYLRAAVFGVGPQRETKSKETQSVVPPRFSITEHTTEEPVKDKTAERKVFISDGIPNKAKKKGADLLPDWLRLGLIETCIVLGLMNLLFVAFVIFQLPYLFGGMELVQQTPDFKLAEYARRGVAELISVSALVLPILLLIHWLLKEQKISQRVFQILASVQIGLLFVIMISASQRLSLLTGSLGYGQTTFRFYSYFFLIWLALVFVWFGMTVLRGMRKQFAYGAMWSALFVVGMLHYVNPDDYIVRWNVDLMNQGRSFDASYNADLSADAAQALIESMDNMSNDDRNKVIEVLTANSCHSIPNKDWRSWNWSRSVSDRLLYKNNIGYLRTCR